MDMLENEGESAGGGVPGERESEGYSGGGEGNSAAAACNRWPQEETLALLNIRLEMDPAFRDAGVKAPLWDEVSRSAAKCKEKFENLYKYHKRTKQNRLARSNAKSYRFFDQLEALDHQFSPLCPATKKKSATDTLSTMTAMPISIRTENAPPPVQFTMPNSLQLLASDDVSTSSSSGNEYEGSRRMKRKWQDFFGSIMNTVLQKQEDLHKKFLEALDRCECERIEREEAWKNLELARIKREQKLLEQERLIAATKDAAVIAFLQKISEQGKCFAAQGKSFVQTVCGEEKSTGDEDNHVNGDNSIHSGGSRWPKEEVDALIKVRTNMEMKYQGGDGPKGLWEEISASMKKLGYDRNAKRCKEKWENINKYYRRVKESNKKRPIDSKTCSYFQQLETLYHIKSQKPDNSLENSFRPEELLMHMMNHHHREQEQQQRPPQSLQQQQQENVDQTRDIGDDDEDEDYEDYEEADHQIGAHDTSTRSILA
ncbi:hypothetical protein V2J09_016678 [Rumex salicifolius]